MTCGRARFFAVLAVAVTVFGLAWMSQRTHEVAAAGDWIAARPEPVVVSRLQFWLRELGSREPDRRWLTTSTPDDLDRAAQVVSAEGFDRFGLLSAEEPDAPAPEIPGFQQVDEQTQSWLGIPFTYRVYQATGT